MFKVGQKVFRAKAPDDGGDWAVQHLVVVDAGPNTMVVRPIVGGDAELLLDTECEELYLDQLVCAKECWRQNGKPDVFEQICARKGIHTEEDKQAELARQMDMWGAVDYEDLLRCLI